MRQALVMCKRGLDLIFIQAPAPYNCGACSDNCREFFEVQLIDMP